eukprot:NODE_6253_length_643_cov_1.634680_g5321_i0.p2 GENE.NODE_6253_length_643_cov_1.634680_g5321_i0~~NODE_6253_length_643_cov_1.634680_g5321_i0.p2  ORF type:complete len:82 (-),score=8.49 NODE_6253_length_643_cov_1.634680_g5321_i0:366-611(-)
MLNVRGGDLAPQVLDGGLLLLNHVRGCPVLPELLEPAGFAVPAGCQGAELSRPTRPGRGGGPVSWDMLAGGPQEVVREAVV